MQASSPACTELETVVMDWLGKMVGLPDHFLHSSKDSPGGGVIQVGLLPLILFVLVDQDALTGTGFWFLLAVWVAMSLVSVSFTICASVLLSFSLYLKLSFSVDLFVSIFHLHFISGSLYILSVYFYPLLY